MYKHTRKLFAMTTTAAKRKKKVALSAATLLTAVTGIAGSASTAHAASYIVFTDNQTGRVLEVSTCFNSSCNVDTIPPSEVTGGAQLWSPQWHSDGSYTFTNYYGGCLDSDATPEYSGTAGSVYVLPCNGGVMENHQLRHRARPLSALVVLKRPHDGALKD